MSSHAMRRSSSGSMRGPLMLLRAGATDAEAAKTFSRYSLTRTSGDCAPLYGSLGLERYELCPIEVMTP